MALIEQSSLFFTRLVNLQDSYEGHLTRATVERIAFDAAFGSDSEDAARKYVNSSLSIARTARHLICVSCWHMSSVESVAMWDLYMPRGQGIAINTTVQGIKESLKETSVGIAMSGVQYVDFDNFDINEKNVFSPATIKRVGYEHEKEVRLMAFETEGIRFKEQGEAISIDQGFHVQVSLESLIDSVYISPFAPDWHVELVKGVLQRANLDVPVFHSKLNAPPEHLYSLDFPIDMSSLTPPVPNKTDADTPGTPSSD